MARARAERARSKSAILEEISQSLERLQSFIPQIEDLGRDGFPYLEGARARTELQLKECIRKSFGEKSREYEGYRKHRVSVDTPADTKQTVAFIKSLIATLEDKKIEVQGLKVSPPAESPPPPPSAPSSPSSPPAPPARPHIGLVPPAIPTAQVTITPATPVSPPPMMMAVAVTTNLDMTQASVARAVGSAPANQATAPERAQQLTEATGASSVQTPPHATAQKSSAVASAPLSSSQPAAATEEITVAAAPSAGPRAHRTLSQTPEIKTDPAMESPRQAHPPASVPARQAKIDSMEIVKSLCKRFHLVARQLRLRGEYRATLDIEDEFDVQDLLHALLRLHFDDIETVEWAPGYSNGSPRVVFLLDDGRLAVIVKKTRTGLSMKDLAEQLRVDVEQCGTLKRCSALLCFVYDPEGRIGNPRGVEADLISVSDQLTVDVYIAPK